MERMKEKKTPRKKSAASRTRREQTRDEDPKPAPVEEENPMDFGGLPQRDLKKNLGGCG